MDQDAAEKTPKTETESIEEQVVSAQPTLELKPSSNKGKIITIVFVILIIIGIGYYLLVINPGVLSMFNSKQPSQEGIPTVTETAISDPQIDKDIQSLNNKMTGLDTDFNNIDYGLADKPVITE